MHLRQMSQDTPADLLWRVSCISRYLEVAASAPAQAGQLDSP